ncbi:MAG: YafY family transcriptional regulator [Anaerolineales bacterium]|nr:YafY family transcriptional regulator [Anaerolineales bacterium]
MANTATRLITLILLLQRHPNQKAGDLAQKLGVSVRSLHRYVDMLDEMGIPVYSERGPGGGFSLVRGFKMPPLIFTPEEAVTVCLGAELAKEMWGRLYEEAAQGALAKIENVLPDEQRDEVAWARRSLVTAGLHYPSLAECASLLETLRGAIRAQKRVRMFYQGSQQTAPIGREVDPYALTNSRGWWYVVGFCRLRDNVRSFRLDRIHSLEVLDTGFERPEDFDARRYLIPESRSAAVRGRLKFAPAAAHLVLNNRFWWEAVEQRPDGSALATFSAPDLIWAASLALSYGPAVTIEEPEELRRLVGEWASAVAGFYSGTPESTKPVPENPAHEEHEKDPKNTVLPKN